MEKETVISVKGLSKKYRIGLKEEMHDSLASSITSFLKSPLKSFKKLRGLSSMGDNEDDVFYALNNISFEVKKGDVLGIIGMNGAGKSTLLKVLSRITEPTEGEINIKGRVASLLEVGTGFHPDLTGRENIYLNGTILGMTRKEIDTKMEEIIEFSGVAKFIDTPVKRYSSGMRVRLAFSVAAHLDPEILIIDEVLAVGDYEFQNKCIGKMQDVASGGKTILFVSHNMAAVNQLCTRAILLKKGEKIADGSVAEIISCYKANNNTSENSKGFAICKPSEDLTFQLAKLSLFNSKNKIADHFDFDEKIKIEIDFKISKKLPNYYLNFTLTNIEEITVLVSTDEELSDTYFAGQLEPGDYRYDFELPASLLKPGKYSISLFFCNQFYPVIQSCPGILSFEIVDTTTTRGKKQLYRKDAIVAPEIKWNFKQI